MQELKLWETSFSKLVNYYSSLEELLTYINKSGKWKFHVVNKYGYEQNEIATNLNYRMIEEAQKHNVKITFFDENHFAYLDNLNFLCIDEDFFEANKNDIIKAVEANLYDKKIVNVSKYVYSEALIKNLMLTAETIYFEEGIEISNEIKELLNRNLINSCIKNADGDEQISERKILGVDYNMVVSDSDFLSFFSDIKDLENLKLIPPHKVISINAKGFSDMGEKELDDVYNIISTLRQNNQNNKIVIEHVQRKALLKSKLLTSNFDNVQIGGLDSEKYDLEEFKKENDLLNQMVGDIRVSFLSPFEKYIAVYNIVKKFKKYKENDEDKTQARRIRKILNNDYMVCVGYASLLEDLLSRVGVNAYNYTVLVDTSYDDGFTLEEKPVNLEKHARLIVNINDPKYDINGFYVADPTWDNDLDKDYYNHALINFDKTTMENRFFELSKEDLLMNVKNIDEYKEKLNILRKMLNRSSTANNKEKQSYNIIVQKIRSILKDLDKESYNKLEEKYSKIKEALENIEENEDYLNSYIMDAGYIFIGKNGKDIPIETIIEAAAVVNKEVFGFTDEQKESYKEQLLEENIKFDKLYFPLYYNNSKIK